MHCFVDYGDKKFNTLTFWHGSTYGRLKTRFLDELEDYLTYEAAEQTLRAIVGWARFAELLAYDDDTGMFSMENPGHPVSDADDPPASPAVAGHEAK